MSRVADYRDGRKQLDEGCRRDCDAGGATPRDVIRGSRKYSH